MTRPTLAAAVGGCLLALSAALPAQPFPDMMYFKLNEATGLGGSTANVANPGVGSPVATMTGHSLVAGVGQFGGGIVAATTASTANNVDTGWMTSFGTGSWTISYWADVSFASTSTLYYVFGDNTASSFRCFYNGAAGVGNCMLRGGGLTDTTVPGAGAGGGHTVTFVYDSTVPEMRGYVDGVLVVTQPQGAPNINGTGTFRIAGANTSGSWSNNVILDEFRVWSQALTPGDVAASWAVELFDQNILSVSQSGPGVGDLTVSLTSLSPTANEGWLLVSGDTTAIEGTGPFFGLRPDVSTWFLLFNTPIADGNPFHFPIPSQFGLFPNNPFFVGPGSVSSLAGTTLDITALLVSSPGPFYDSRSQVVRYTFQ